MKRVVKGYWFLTWLGLLSNIAALVFIGIIGFGNSDFQPYTYILAISLAWPAAVVGIVASAGLLAERTWGVVLAIVALSMSLGNLPYGIIRLILQKDIVGISGLSMLIGILNVLALIYWCRPIHRKNIRL